MSSSSLENLGLPPIPARLRDGHKGTFGTVLVIGGCDNRVTPMIGAPAFTALGALRTGCGLAKMAMPQSILNEGLTVCPSATGLALDQEPDGHLNSSAAATRLTEPIEQASALAVGPGWGVGANQQQLLMWLLAQDECPVVLDADGLNNLAQVPDFGPDLHAPLIVTPHPGEYARLAENLGIEADPKDDATRPEAADRLAQRLGCVVVLKGAGTVISDGLSHWVCPVRNPALATAGTGDVLTGVIASLVAQFWKPHLGPMTPEKQGGMSLYDAARWGVAIHGRAAEQWSAAHGSAGLIASDLAEAIPAVIAEARGENINADGEGSQK